MPASKSFFRNCRQIKRISWLLFVRPISAIVSNNFNLCFDRKERFFELNKTTTYLGGGGFNLFLRFCALQKKMKSEHRLNRTMYQVKIKKTLCFIFHETYIFQLCAISRFHWCDACICKKKKTSIIHVLKYYIFNWRDKLYVLNLSPSPKNTEKSNTCVP